MKNPSPAASRGAIWFAMPYTLVFALFMGWPILHGVWLSLTDTSLAAPRVRLLGMANYLEALSDPVVWSSLGNTVVFTAMSSVPLIVISFIVAYLVSTGLPGQWLWRLIFFGPFLLPVSVVTAIWGMTYANDFGLINGILVRLGAQNIPFLSDASVAMWSIALVTLWWTLGFNFLLYLAALQEIPEHVYEAAAIDGAGPLRRLFSVTLPMLRPTTMLIVMLQILASLKVFDQIFLLTAGGPDGATRSILHYIYEVGFSGYRLGYASAISYLFFALIVLFSLAQFALTNRQSKES